MKKLKLKLSEVIIMIVLFLLILTIIIPILNILASSLTPAENIYELKPWSILPHGLTLDYYKLILSDPALTGAFLNSVFITFFHVCFALVSTTMAAYALSVKGIKYKPLIMTLLIIVMVFEPGVIQEFMVVKSLHLLDTKLLLIILNSTNVFYLIILLRFFSEIPDEIIEAAQIDGAGHFRIFTQITVPLAKPFIITIGLFYGILKWNEYFKASIYMISEKNYTLQLILNRYVVQGDVNKLLETQSRFTKDQLLAMDMGSLSDATIIFALIPALVIFPLVLKYHVKDQFAGGNK